MKTIEVL